MSGYTPTRKTYRLVFEDPDMRGLEVRTYAPALGDVLHAPSDGHLLTVLGDTALIEWNMLHPSTGAPVPATRDGLLSLDADLTLTILRAWTNAYMGVSVPLVQPSSSGAPSPAESLPMEPLSESPPS